MRPILAIAAILVLVAAAALFVAGAITAENALHPPRRHVAAVCPCMSHVRCRDASVRAPDGVTGRAWYFEPAAPNGGAVLVLHGIGASREDVVPVGTVFLRAGYAVLEPDLRGHGESGGFATYGVDDEQDIQTWASCMLQQPTVERIYGFGASLGASVLLDALHRETRFRAVIAEAAFADFPDIARERIGRLLPEGLKWLSGPFVASGILWAKMRYGTDLRQSSAVEWVRHAHVPILLIHGLKDDKTSPDNSRELAAANPANTQLWLVPGGHHADAWSTTGKRFELRVTAWFGEH